MLQLDLILSRIALIAFNVNIYLDKLDEKWGVLHIIRQSHEPEGPWNMSPLVKTKARKDFRMGMVPVPTVGVIHELPLQCDMP